MSRSTTHKAASNHVARNRVKRFLLYLILIIGSLVMFYPMLFGILASFSTMRDYFSPPYWIPIPRHFSLENYKFVFTSPVLSAEGGITMGRFVANTVLRILWYIVVPGSIAILAGYVFARIDFRGRETVFLILLGSMMIPGIIYLIPTFVMLARFPLAGGNNWLGQGGTGFINRWGALLIPGMVNVYYIFLLRQTFFSIPRDFEDAAQVDGANRLQIISRIYLPMVKPTITVMALGQAVGNWNDFQWPLIVSVGNPKLWTISLASWQVMMNGLYIKGSGAFDASPGGAGTKDYPFAFTIATLMSLPTVLLFIFLQRYFVEGMQGFAIKG